MKKKIFILFYSLISFSLYCQDIGLNEIKNIKVDNLSDKQIKDFLDKNTKAGYTIEQLEEQAIQSGMSPMEWKELNARIQKLSNSEKNQDYASSISLSRSTEQQADYYSVETNDEIRIYGSSLFNTPNPTFEPNLRLPTPENYLLGPDDELIIDVFGLSEANYRLQISPEGVIHLPGIGQIHISGLTIAKAKKLITNKLALVFNAINHDKTFVSVTLGNIRSIKVIVVGEAFKPGTYTLPSVASVYNTLNACGGPNRNGSFREVKVIRNNKTIAVVDVYDFLSTGEMKNNIQLQDQDVLRIEPYKKRIELKGELKNTGYFEAKDGEFFQTMVNYAGGFTTNVYKDRVVVFRNTEKEKKVEDILFNDFGSFVVEDGDVFEVSSLLDRFENRVQIKGAVFRPGTYALSNSLTLSQLIKKADGIKEDAFLHRGTIVREKDNKETEILSFNVNAVISGKTDVVLKKEDIITIASAIEMKEIQRVSIYGEVKTPGEYPFHEKMTLQDLIFASGGTKEDAELNNIEIYRLETDPTILRAGTQIAERHTFTINKNLDGLDFDLVPHDNVIIRPISGYTVIKKAMVEGEVLFPGNYVLTSNRERISDLILKAGGLSKFAYPDGAFMIRKLSVSIAEEKKEQKVVENISDELIDLKEYEKKEAIVGINLQKILQNPCSEEDLFLEDGDIISIPKELQIVQVSGEVFLPSLVRFDSNSSFKHYISNSGGFSPNALKRKSYIVYANGEIQATKRILFFRNYPEVKPGAKIYVPEKPERVGNRMTLGESIALTSSFVTMTALIISIFRKY
ncbi:MAG: SLBB domain-containing protein [Prevotellaceae bacterium]|jgi:protein involved in polysaccharide export with SLBB domain|nr:SLBB domain-containing protein [Prevotellaceae bacterium]